MKDVDEAVAKIRQRYIAAVAGRDARALIQLYDPKVRVFDAWGIWEYNGAASWQVAIEGWFSSHPTQQLRASFSHCTVLGQADMATMSAIVSYAGLAADGTELQSMQNRITWILKESGHNLRIVHEHTSPPIGFDDMKAILKMPAP
jgi:ketosteroid isomerase-like protein